MFNLFEISRRRAIRRGSGKSHKHKHGPFGRFGRGFSDDLGRGGRFGRGRKFAAAELQLLILALLAENPRHGYEIIKALDERSNGFYSPSPGMVYPALTYLDEIGRATVAAEGTKKLYQITEDGLAHLEANRAAVDAALAQLDWIGRRMGRVREIIAGDERQGDGASDDLEGRTFDGHGDRFAPEVRRARRKLKAALIEKIGAAPAEQRRIAGILERAVTEILERADPDRR